jgi:type IV pilus assembly protein PilC
MNILPLSNSETSAFCSQIAMILKSGISSTEGIAIMLEDTDKNDEKQLLTTIYDTLTQTGNLHEALQETHAFPDYMLSMVDIGERTGRLDEVMGSLADYYEKEAGLAQTIKNAITYPCIMIFMMLAVILILITKVMPVFEQVFLQLGTRMSGPSRVILNIGTFLNTHSIVLIIIIVVLIAIAIILIKTKIGQNFISKLAARFGGSKNLSEKICAYRFAGGMALTLSSGLTPEECLNLASSLIDDGAYKDKIKTCQQAVENGEDLYQSLLSCGVFSGVYTRMAAIAARTGMMEEMMLKIAAHFEEEIDQKIARILAIIEPTLVIILSVIVGIILLSVMLPLMSIMSTL